MYLNYLNLSRYLNYKSPVLYQYELQVENRLRITDLRQCAQKAGKIKYLKKKASQILVRICSICSNDNVVREVALQIKRPQKPFPRRVMHKDSSSIFIQD